MDDVELLFLLPQVGQWGTLNIQTMEQRRGEFKFQCERPFRSKVHFYPKSQWLSIFEMGTYNSEVGRVSLIPYPRT